MAENRNAMKKYINVDLFAELQKLVDLHVMSYKDDFDIDKRILLRAMKSNEPEEKTLLWFCRKCGTHCLRENQAFIKDTREHNTVRYYYEQSREVMTARIVVPKQLCSGKLMGDIYEVDFNVLASRIANNSVSPQLTELSFEDGFSATIPFDQGLRQAHAFSKEHGRAVNIRVLPADTSALEEVLSEQGKRRNRLTAANAQEKLHSLPVAEYRSYQAIKQDNPNKLICFAQNGYFELYGDDAKKAAVILGTKLLDKKMRGHEPLPVTGFKIEAWVSASHKLWKTGMDVLMIKDGQTFKELKAEDYIPVGARLEVAGIMSRIDAVDFTSGKVELTNIESAERPITYIEDIAYVRSFVEDAGIAVYDTVPKEKRSIRDKLKAPEPSSQKEQSNEKKKAKSKEMEI